MTHRLRRSVLALAIAVTLTTGAAGTAWLNAGRADDTERASRAALSTATPATRAIFSYDYRRFDASVDNGKQFVTGTFAQEYAETTRGLKEAAGKEHAIVRAEVSAAGVVQATPDRVEVLLFVNQFRQNINISGEKVDQNRVVLTLVPVGAQWRVVRAAAL